MRWKWIFPGNDIIELYNKEITVYQIKILLPDGPSTATSSPLRNSPDNPWMIVFTSEKQAVNRRTQ